MRPPGFERGPLESTWAEPVFLIRWDCPSMKRRLTADHADWADVDVK